MPESYPAIDSDRDQLVETERPRRNWCFGHSRLALFVTTLCLILLGHGLAIYFIYFRCSSVNCSSLKVRSLNTWGMPATLGSARKEDRMEGIGQTIAKGDYDVFLLEELWMEPDHTTIASHVPKDYFVTYFRQLALSTCDGRVGPEFCSGLTVISRFNFTETEFNSFTYHGDPLKATIDGEWLARKGVGRVRINPVQNINFDIFITHTAADPDPSHGYNNSYYRDRQVKEIVETYIRKSTADIVILGGDFNAEPETAPGSPYQLITQFMTNCVHELFYKFNKWMNESFATYGNKLNTFTGGVYKPVTYDYIFHRSNNKNRTQAWTNWFQLSFFSTWINNHQEEISLSDHQGIEATIYFWK